MHIIYIFKIFVCFGLGVIPGSAQEPLPIICLRITPRSAGRPYAKYHVVPSKLGLTLLCALSLPSSLCLSFSLWALFSIFIQIVLYCLSFWILIFFHSLLCLENLFQLVMISQVQKHVSWCEAISMVAICSRWKYILENWLFNLPFINP